MDAYEETFKTWNKVASDYESKFMQLSIYNPSYDFVIERLSEKPVAILELGCGPGNIARYFLEKRPQDNWLGIDIAPEMIALAKKNNEKATFKLLDIRNINSLEQQFNVMIAGFCFPYMSLSDIKKFLSDCVQMIARKGMLYISFVEGVSELSGFQVNSKGNRMYFYYHSKDDIINALLDFGFHIVKTIHIKQQNQEKQTVLIAVYT